jgi:uncharacterized damage-inducible protein DinB
MGSIATIISDLDFGRTQLLQAIEGLSERELTEIHIYDGWTIKDLLAHIIGWDQWVLCTLPLLVENQTEEVPHVESDEFNQKAVEAWQDKSIAEIRAELKITHRQILDMISQLDHVEIDLRRERQGRVITIRSYVIDMMVEHERKHAVEIAAWRKTLGQAIDPEAVKSSLAQNRAEFWAALEGLSPTEAQAPAGRGNRSIQAVVGHVADWQERMFKAARHIHDPSWPAPAVAADQEVPPDSGAVRPWPEVTERLQAVEAELDAFLARLNRGDWQLRGPYPWPNDQGTLAELISHAAEHYAHHLPDVRR